MSEEKKVSGVFIVNGIKDTNKAKITHVNNMENNQIINDNFHDSYKIDEDTTGDIYKCNISDRFLMSTKELPLFYINVILKKFMQSTLLFKLCFYFNVESNLQNVEDLLDKEIEGSFSVVILVNNHKKVLNSDIKNFKGDEEHLEQLKKFTKDDQMIDLMNSMKEDIISNLRKQYGDRYHLPSSPPKKIISLKNYGKDEKPDQSPSSPRKVDGFVGMYSN